MPRKLTFLGLALYLFLFSGCIFFHHVGKRGVSWSEITDPGDLKTKSTKKADALQLYGAPDEVYRHGNREMWVYHLSRAFYIVVYGESEYQDLVLTFDDKGNLVEYKFLPKGKSFALFLPGTVVR